MSKINRCLSIGFLVLVLVGCGAGGTTTTTGGSTATDTIPPTVTSCNPSNNATNVALSSSIGVTFSEVMNASTISNSTFILKDSANNVVSGNISYSGITATFTPSTALIANATYTATIASGVKDTVGNQMVFNYTWSFATHETTPPIVSSTAPVSNAINVSIYPLITVTFSEAMNAPTITTTSFTLSNGVAATIGTVVYNAITKTATFTPTNKLDNNMTYTATITTGVQDIAGNALAPDYTWSFKTLTAFTIPDTGQTGDYTATFGEDSDYTINPPSYADNGNGTITDNVTNLMWQKQDDGTTRTWANAMTYCENLSLGGQSDWRLPNIDELISIVNYGTYTPAINTTYFPNTQSFLYWSSTTDAYYTVGAWVVRFDVGLAYAGNANANKTTSHYVRCVR